ncbi:MAG: dihydrolipoyl dehydrogenase [Armatimonadota bacterium]|nr:dihydrolipoyl dehydrogenase [Armatimonadota bacterium]MDR7580562.1 dihydrolipoyl dehydrogenase [Armatimonadota bacterium]MDR7595403.1 dihydrolipoyl dehydrogenase [Armatimonadota bacterium]
MQDTYDLVVIGAGPGGYVGAIRAAQLGMRTAIVERDKLGGTCLHYGCIPTKALLQVAEVAELARHAPQVGVRVESVSVDLSAVHRYRERTVSTLHRGVEYLMRKNGIATFAGTARLVARDRVHVSLNDGSETELRARHVLIATGSRPRSLPWLALDGERVFSSDHLVSLQEVPGKLAVLGAGVIGVEFASAFASLGSQVTVIEILPRALPAEDEEVSAALEKAFARRGIRVLTSASLKSVERTPTGLQLSVERDGKVEGVEADRLLVAVGRGPVTDGLGLEEVGVEVDGQGFVRTQGVYRTTAPGIWAIGDVIHAQPMLAHVASEEAVRAVEDMAGHAVAPLDYDAVPRCTYCSPEVASFGLTEVQARERGYEVRVGRFPFSANSKALILGEREGFVKVVTDARHGEILGMHMVGPRVTELVPEGILGKSVEATIHEVAAAVHAHPTLAEAIHEAALDALGRVVHL